MSRRDDRLVIDTDVLILGGGFAGAWAALRAADLGANVTLVDKAFVSRSGASAISGGITTCPLEDDDLDDWAAEFIERGSYMCDQDWTRQLLELQRDRVQDYQDWDVPILRDNDGSIRRVASRGMINVRGMQYKPKAAMIELRKRIQARGVDIVDRVFITDLLTEDGKWPTASRIVGATGFNVRTGQFVVFRAKQVILATGLISMKGTNSVDNDTGDGVSMAYRAGARLIDMEFSFGGTFTVMMKRLTFPSYNVAVANGAKLINANGERFMKKYDPVRVERTELSWVVAAFAKELLDGRGPVFVDLRDVNENYWSDIVALSRENTVLFPDTMPDPRENPILIEPKWGLWEGGGRCGVQIDLRCRTNLPGLLAAGGTAKNDATGTHASAGAPTAFSFCSGWLAGETAAQASREIELCPLDEDVLDQLEQKTFLPLERNGKGETADQLHAKLGGLEASIFDGMILSEPGLERMLATVEDVRAGYEVATAESLHDLAKLHEVQCVADCAELTYRSALDRTESREQFYREEYPEIDDDNWFCWHAATRSPDGELCFERIPIPDRPGWLKRPGPSEGLGPVAAILSGRVEAGNFH